MLYAEEINGIFLILFQKEDKEVGRVLTYWRFVKERMLFIICPVYLSSSSTHGEFCMNSLISNALPATTVKLVSMSPYLNNIRHCYYTVGLSIVNINIPRHAAAVQTAILAMPGVSITN